MKQQIITNDGLKVIASFRNTNKPIVVTGEESNAVDLVVKEIVKEVEGIYEEIYIDDEYSDGVDEDEDLDEDDDIDEEDDFDDEECDDGDSPDEDDEYDEDKYAEEEKSLTDTSDEDDHEEEDEDNEDENEDEEDEEFDEKDDEREDDSEQDDREGIIYFGTKVTQSLEEELVDYIHVEVTEEDEGIRVTIK